MFGFTKTTFVAILASLAVINAAPVAEAENAHVLEARVSRTGRMTYFEPGLGACGWNSGSDDWIVALNSPIFQKNGGSNCGQGVRITVGGKTRTAVVVDECPSCGEGDLDLSPSLFAALSADGGLDAGVLTAKWNFLKRN